MEDQAPLLTPEQYQGMKSKGYLNDSLDTSFQPGVPPQEMNQVVQPEPPPPIEPMPYEQQAQDPNMQLASMPIEESAQPVPGPLDQAYQQKAEAIKSAAAAGAAEAQAEASYRKQAAVEAETKFAEDEARIAQGQERATEAMAKLQEKMDKVSEMKVDSGRFWAEKTTGQKILAGLSLAMGAYGSAHTGRGNDALNIITNSIEKDIDAQRQDIGQAKQDIAGRGGIYRDMLGAYGDQQMALNAARAAYYRGVEQNVEAMASRAKGSQIKANADMLLGDLSLKRASEEEKLRNRAIQLASINSGNIQPELLDEAQLARFVPGQGLALDKESAKIMREATVNTKNSVDSIQGLLSIGNRPGKAFSLSDRKEAEVLATSLKAALRSELIGPGAVSESEWKLLDSIVANPTKILTLDSSNEIALKTLGKKMEKNLAEKAKTYIMNPTGQTPIRTTSQNPGGYSIVK